MHKSRGKTNRLRRLCISLPRSASLHPLLCLSLRISLHFSASLSLPFSMHLSAFLDASCLSLQLFLSFLCLVLCISLHFWSVDPPPDQHKAEAVSAEGALARPARMVPAKLSALRARQPWCRRSGCQCRGSSARLTVLAGHDSQCWLPSATLTARRTGRLAAAQLRRRAPGSLPGSRMLG